MAWTDVPLSRVARLITFVFLLIAVLLFGAWLLVRLWSLVVLMGLALLVGTALIPYVDWITRLTHRRGPAVALVMLSLLLVVIGFGLLVLPPMVDQGTDLYNRAPELQERIAQFADDRGWVAARDRIRAFEFTQLVSADLAVRTGLGAIGFFVAFFTMLFLTLYFLLDANRLTAFVRFATPRHWHRHIEGLMSPLKDVVGAYIRGQAVTSASIGVFSLAMLLILRVPNALALAGIAMVADLIPLVGVFILMTVMVVTALLVSPTTAIIVFGAMLVYQQFEDRLLVPRVYGTTLRLPTIAVVVALLIGAELMGILGALVALPIAAALRVVVEYFARERKSSAAVAAQAVQTRVEPDVFAPDTSTPENGTGARPARR